MFLKPTHPVSIDGVATFYPKHAIGQPMATGRPYRADDFTVATTAFPLGTKVLATYRAKHGTLRHVACTVTDRPDRWTPVSEGGDASPASIILSWAAFRRLENYKAGTIPVTLTQLNS